MSGSEATGDLRTAGSRSTIGSMPMVDRKTLEDPSLRRRISDLDPPIAGGWSQLLNLSDPCVPCSIYQPELADRRGRR